MKILKTASGKTIIKMSKREWKEIGTAAGWSKMSQVDNMVKGFYWEDLNNGSGTWDIQYRELDPSEYYGEAGKSVPDRDVMLKMIVSVQNKEFDSRPIERSKIPELIDRLIDPSEFFDMVESTNREYEDEWRIEQRDIDAGLLDR